MKSKKRITLASCKAAVSQATRVAFDLVRKRDQTAFALFVTNLGVELLAIVNGIPLKGTETHVHINREECAVTVWREPARPIVDLLHEDDIRDQKLILFAAIASHAHDMKVPIEAVVDGVLIQLGKARTVEPSTFN